MNAQSLTERKFWPMFKIRSKVMVTKSHVKYSLYHLTSLAIRNTYAKYESPISYKDKQVMVNI